MNIKDMTDQGFIDYLAGLSVDYSKLGMDDTAKDFLESVKRIRRLTTGVSRLASMEAFEVSRAVNKHDDELIARVSYAQTLLRE